MGPLLSRIRSQLPRSWTTNCAANSQTNGVDLKTLHTEAQPQTPRRLIAKGEIIDKSQAIAVGLPQEFVPTLPQIEDSGGVIKSYVLDAKTGVVSKLGLLSCVVCSSRLSFPLHPVW